MTAASPMTTASIIAFAVILIALTIGYLAHRTPLRDDWQSSGDQRAPQMPDVDFAQWEVEA